MYCCLRSLSGLLTKGFSCRLCAWCSGGCQRRRRAGCWPRRAQCAAQGWQLRKSASSHCIAQQMITDCSERAVAYCQDPISLPASPGKFKLPQVLEPNKAQYESKACSPRGSVVDCALGAVTGANAGEGPGAGPGELSVLLSVGSCESLRPVTAWTAGSLAT